MHFKGGFPVMSALLLLFVTQACHAQLMCYVCDNCAQITTDTPQFLCDASFFATTGPTLPSTMTTTEEPTTTPLATSPSTMETSPSTTTPSTTSSTTTEAPTTTVTEEASPSTTTPVDTTTGASTEAPIPTPPTIGPPETTTSLPTPTNQGTVIIPVDTVTMQMNALDLGVNATVATPSANASITVTNTTKMYVPSSELRVRQLRQVMQTDVTYHCYRVQRNDNGKMVSNRGCSRVTAKEGVCSQLQLASNTTQNNNNNNNNKMNKCFACSTKLCNGSSALNVSVLALLVGAVAALLRH